MIGRGLPPGGPCLTIAVLVMKYTTHILALTTLLALGQLTLTAADAGKGFRPLFNGKDLTGWKLRRPEAHNTWSVLPGGILKNTVENGQHGVDL